MNSTKDENERAKTWLIIVLSITLFLVVAAFIIREIYFSSPEPEKYEVIEKERNFWKSQADSLRTSAAEQEAIIEQERAQYINDIKNIKNAQKKFETMGLDSNVVFFLSWTNSSPTE